MEESNKNEHLMKERQQIRYLYTAEELDQHIRQKMAQSNQEISELRNNELLAMKQEMDKLKEDNQKLAMTLTTTTMELNRFRKRWGADLATIDRNRAKRRKLDFSARKQLAMEMTIKVCSLVFLVTKKMPISITEILPLFSLSQLHVYYFYNSKKSILEKLFPNFL
jgi:hypothetical protein